MCGMLFIIPAPIAAPVAAAPGPFHFGGAPTSSYGPVNAYPGAEAPQPQVQPQPAAPAEPELLHIPCPNGHELETPVDMLDQEVLCPECQAQFILRRKNSVEFIKHQEELARIRDAKLNNLALKWAIAAAVLVGLGLIALVVMSNLS
jgi:hypothetical protein